MGAGAAHGSRSSAWEQEQRTGAPCGALPLRRPMWRLAPPGAVWGRGPGGRGDMRHDAMRMGSGRGGSRHTRPQGLSLAPDTT
jgi:hypothetical protein